MPVIKTELQSWTAFPKLKKIRALIQERVELYRQEKEIKRRLSGDKKKGTTGLNYELFGDMRMALPKDVKSIEYVAVDPETKIERRYQVTTMVGSARLTLDKIVLVSTPWKVECAHCGKKTPTTLPPKVLEGAMKEGKTPDPTVSVREIGNGEGDDE